MEGVLDIVNDMNMSAIDSYEALLRMRDLCDEDISLVGYLDEKELMLNRIKNLISCFNQILSNQEEDLEYDYYEYYKVG